METTNFFSRMAQVDFTGVLQLNITKGATDNLIVSVLLHNEQCTDKAKNLIPPITLNATPQEFDDGFFDRITKPVEKVSGLMVDMEKFMQQLEETKKQSAMEKEKAEKVKKEQEAKDKKYREAMAKVAELETAGKFREAWMKVPEPNEYPDKTEEIRKRKTDLSAKFAPDLFGTTAQPIKVPEEAEDLQSKYDPKDEDETPEMDDDNENLY